MCWNTGVPAFEISTYISPLYAKFSAMASPPSTDRPFPIARSLGFTHPNKTVIRPQIDHTISRYLYAHVTPPGPSAILPRNHDGHTLSRPKFNTGKTNEQFLGQSFQFVCHFIEICLFSPSRFSVSRRNIATAQSAITQSRTLQLGFLNGIQYFNASY
jgi:hypothetical protein